MEGNKNKQEILKPILLVGTLIVLLLIAIFIWPTLYRYEFEQISSDNLSRRKLVVINRITGKVANISTKKF